MTSEKTRIKNFEVKGKQTDKVISWPDFSSEANVTSELLLRTLTYHLPENIDSSYVLEVLNNQHVTRSISANVFKFSREKRCFAGESQIKLQMFPLPSGRHVDAQYGVSMIRLHSDWYPWYSNDFP